MPHQPSLTGAAEARYRRARLPAWWSTIADRLPASPFASLLARLDTLELPAWKRSRSRSRPTPSPAVTTPELITARDEARRSRSPASRPSTTSAPSDALLLGHLCWHAWPAGSIISFFASACCAAPPATSGLTSPSSRQGVRRAHLAPAHEDLEWQHHRANVPSCGSPFCGLQVHRREQGRSPWPLPRSACPPRWIYSWQTTWLGHVRSPTHHRRFVPPLPTLSPSMAVPSTPFTYERLPDVSIFRRARQQPDPQDYFELNPVRPQQGLHARVCWSTCAATGTRRRPPEDESSSRL
jgi:hypothetical protein